MWPWELKPQELSTLDSELYQGPHLFDALYHIYKASFWGIGIHIGPTHPSIQIDSWPISLIYPFTFENRFWKRPKIMVRVLMK